MLALTAKEVGEARFSDALARYVSEPGDPDEQCRDVVEDFIACLETGGASCDALTLARFEIAKRDCHGDGPRPLSLADLVGLPIASLAKMSVRRHPCARSIAMPGRPPGRLTALYPELRGCRAILLCGRRSGVDVLPLTLDELAVLNELELCRDLFGLLVQAKKLADPSALFRLVQLGAVLDGFAETPRQAGGGQ